MEKKIKLQVSENIQSVIAWADAKGLIRKENSFQQFTKTVEEVGEIASALCKNKPEELEDAIGDVLVTLIILAAQNDLTIDQCLDTAYNEIKNRTGKTVDGVFVKD